ncbi:MAG: hypothetical protein PUE95_05640 [Lachnospiraceae bacterium]|nr:hypothetical protein [Lachnospiraceae bacterium]
MNTITDFKTINVLEVLYGEKTTLVCKKEEIETTGQLRITDLHGNSYIEHYNLSMPKQCFTSKDIMFLNIDDKSISLDSKVECI